MKSLLLLFSVIFSSFVATSAKADPYYDRVNNFVICNKTNFNLNAAYNFQNGSEITEDEITEGWYVIKPNQCMSLGRFGRIVYVYVEGMRTPNNKVVFARPTSNPFQRSSCVDPNRAFTYRGWGTSECNVEDHRVFNEFDILEDNFTWTISL